MRTPRVTLRLALVAVVALLALTPMLASAYDWEQFDGTSQHSGNNTQETTINRNNVVGLQQTFQVNLPSNDVADGAPVYLSNVVTGTSTVNTVYVTTKGGRLVALNANTGAVIWTRRPATGPNYTTSSPVLDPNHQYVYSYGLEGKVHKYNVSNGAETIDAHWPETATLKPSVEKGSSALSTAIAQDGIPRLYVTNGGYPGDAGDYQGHLTAINLNTGAQNVFNMACSNQAVHFTTTSPDCTTVQNALWARPGVVYDAATNRIYVTGSNGHYSGNTGGYDWSESTVALNPDGTSNAGTPLDSYTPTNFQQLDDTDADIGSTNPVILPPPPGSAYQHLAAQSGKDGKIRLLNLDNMSGQGGPRHLGGELGLINTPVGSTTLPTPAVWTNPADGSIWYFISNYSGIAGMQLTADCSGTPHLNTRWTQTPGSVSSPLIANNVLYYFSAGGIVAADPTSGNTLWSDNNLGGLHWESPIVDNGMLYITDESGQLTAYHINASVPTVVPATSTPRATSTPCQPTNTPTPTRTPTPAPTFCANPFVDINGNIFFTAINYLYCQHVVNGTDATHYSPAGSSTRGQFAKVVVLGFGLSLYTPSGGGQDFTDVPSSYFAYLYIETGLHAGILSGFDATSCQNAGAIFPCYIPNRSITRGQLTKLVVSAAGYPLYTPSGSQDFTDVAPSNVFYASVETAFHKGVISGYADHTFRPNNNIRRDEMAQVVYKGVTTP